MTSIPFHGDGAGYQALMKMYAINFVRAFGLTYVHTPFSQFFHADRPVQEYADAWEAQFNLPGRDRERKQHL